MAKKIVLIRDGCVRDAQILSEDPSTLDDYHGDDGNWTGFSGEFFLGVYEGTDEEAMAKAADDAGVNVGILTTIDV